MVQSKNSATLPYLLPMLKDGDPFVRRLTAEGLARFKQASSVDALLVTLADPKLYPYLLLMRPPTLKS